jgi:hypothetical protein
MAVPNWKDKPTQMELNRFVNDDIELLENMVKYLKEYKQ